ncbi:hypothetical protein RN001_003697 [Aquatica leii]|uniref:MADF domain-containing protein n=1 Tax=Aquatica leii TaxID=1421715 RepID=A0AAN7PP41_9COLE|nr:hypothetical protein RN001_003697 [Aquatica leii]
MKTKFANLKTTFMQEFRKYKESFKSGIGTEDIYTPTLWYFEEIKYVAEHNEIQQAYDLIGTIEDVADDDEAGLEDDSCKGNTTSNDIEDTMVWEGTVEELATLGNSATPRNKLIKRIANSGYLNVYLKSANSAISDMRATVIQNAAAKKPKVKHLGNGADELTFTDVEQVWGKDSAKGAEEQYKKPTRIQEYCHQEHFDTLLKCEPRSALAIFAGGREPLNTLQLLSDNSSPYNLPVTSTESTSFIVNMKGYASAEDLFENVKRCNKVDHVLQKLIFPTTEFHRQQVLINKQEFVELLISLILIRPPLWDSRLPLPQRSKTIRDKLWAEISEQFGEQEEYSIEVLMKKWRNLRDTYVRLKGEYDSYVPSGSANKKKKRTWEFYDQMGFLNDTLNYRNLVNIFMLYSSTTTNLAKLSSASSSGDEYKKRKEKPNSTDVAIIDAINRINSPATSIETASIEDVNPICLRISQILKFMPQRERTDLEIKLLQLTFETAKDYL